MSDNGRISLLFLLNLILYFLIGEANNSLSALNISLHLDVLIVIFFGLYIGRAIGLLYVLILGFLANAAHPVPPGTYVLGYLFLWIFLVGSRHRIRRQNSRHVRTMAVLAQFILIIGFSIFLGRASLGMSSFWQRILFDLLASTLIVYIFAWPWCCFQRSILNALGWNLEARLAHR